MSNHLSTLNGPRFESAISFGIPSVYFVGLDLHMYYEFCIISPPGFTATNHPNARLLGGPRTKQGVLLPSTLPRQILSTGMNKTIQTMSTGTIREAVDRFA